MEQKKIKKNKNYFLFFWQAVRLFMARHLKKKKERKIVSGFVQKFPIFSFGNVHGDGGAVHRPQNELRQKLFFFLKRRR
jgi:TPP-dependent trihydroxycyclohexane-1,2-dione (THcHDO) dehydratase